MEQYTADNERLRKKVSELGERMEFYKEKCLKYRTLYQEMADRDANQRPPSVSGSSQQAERHSSTSSASRENVAGIEPLFLI